MPLRELELASLERSVRNANVVEASVSLDYAIVLNIGFLALAKSGAFWARRC